MRPLSSVVFDSRTHPYTCEDAVISTALVCLSGLAAFSFVFICISCVGCSFHVSFFGSAVLRSCVRLTVPCFPVHGRCGHALVFLRAYMLLAQSAATSTSHKENKKTNGVGVRNSLEFPFIFLLVVWELRLLRACHLTGVACPVSTVVVGHVLLCLWVNATCTNSSTNIYSRIMDTTISWVFSRYPRNKKKLRGRGPPFENPPRSGSAVR